MNLVTVVDVVFKHFPDKILIYSRDKLIFNGYLRDFIRNNEFDNLIVDTYEYEDKVYKIMIIRVMESET